MSQCCSVFDYLRERDLQMFIVSGGGADFMRPWTEPAYGTPPQNVVDSAIETRYEMRSGKRTLMRTNKIAIADDEAGKPVGIHAFIGKRPMLAVGDSDGDLEMLQWTTVARPDRQLGMLIHHTDGHREYRYSDKGAAQATNAISQSKRNDWTVVDMKRDWQCMVREQRADGGGRPNP